MNEPRAPLTVCSLFRLTDREPTFSGFLEEGDIAYYGLLLQAHGDPALRDYLLANAVNFLWEYQHGYGVTAADSTLVIEGLFARGLTREQLLPSLDRLVELFYLPEEGAFRTVLQGRAAYWRGAQVETTAHAAYLLGHIAPGNYDDIVRRCADYVAARQRADGGWPGQWFPSHTIPVYYAARLLALKPERWPDHLARARQYLLATQRRDGGWGGVIETAAALLALRALDPGTATGEAAVRRAGAWLRAGRGADGWPGELVLYYWFEDEEAGVKTFHAGRDLGRITTAWATLALAAAGQEDEGRQA